MPAVRKSAFAVLVLTLMVTAFFWKLLTKQYTWMDHPDMAFQILPWLQYQASAWHAGHWFPLWDPNVWGGQPLVGQLVPGFTYPLNWPLFLLPFGADGRIQPVFLHAQFIVSHILAAIFAYWLCRDLDRSRAASLLAGLGFSLTGMVGSWGWPQMLNSSIWMPLAILSFRRSIVRGDSQTANAALSGCVTGWMFLGGHHQIPALFALWIGGMWAVRLYLQPLRKVAIPAAAFGLMCVLTAGLQLLPAFEYGAHSLRWVGAKNPVVWGQSVPYNVHQDFQHSFFPSGLLGLVLPNLSTEFSAFVGLAIVTLALIGLKTGFRRFAEIPFIAAACAAAALFAFGGFSIFHGIAYLFVPMAEKLRSPAMAFCMAQVAMVVLAAYGFDAIREDARAVSRRWIAALTGLGSIAWIAVALAGSVRAQTGLEYERPAILGLMAFALAAWLSAWRSGAIGARAMVAALLLGVYFEAGTVTGRDFTHREASQGSLHELTKYRDIIDYLKAQPGPVRLEYAVASNIHYNTGDWDGVPQFEAYLAGLTRNVGRLKGAKELDPLLPKIFALTHFAGLEPSRPATQEEVFQSKSGMRLYRNTDAFPRAWIVHRAVTANEKQLVETLASGFDLRQNALLTVAAPAMESCDGSEETAAIARYEPDLVELNATLACKGMLVVSETWYPGWSASVDGSAAKLYEVDGVIRGVAVDAGAHRVVLRYRPFSVYAGATMTAVGLLIGLLLLFRMKTSRRRSLALP
jgi:hypothetical protein